MFDGAASAVAGSKPMETSFQAWKYAKGLYLIPLFMVFNESIILGGPLPLYLAAVLGGGVFGDHCSPISDTTIMSSMASACDHVDHVRTQLPYALLAAGSAVLVGYLPTGLVNLPEPIAVTGAAGLAVGLHWVLGERARARGDR